MLILDFHCFVPKEKLYLLNFSEDNNGFFLHRARVYVMTIMAFEKEILLSQVTAEKRRWVGLYNLYSRS